MHISNVWNARFIRQGEEIAGLCEPIERQTFSTREAGMSLILAQTTACLTLLYRSKLGAVQELYW